MKILWNIAVFLSSAWLITHALLVIFGYVTASQTFIMIGAVAMILVAVENLLDVYEEYKND